MRDSSLAATPRWLRTIGFAANEVIDYIMLSKLPFGRKWKRTVWHKRFPIQFECFALSNGRIGH